MLTLIKNDLINTKKKYIVAFIVLLSLSVLTPLMLFGIDYNNESNNTKLNLHNIILHYKSLRKVMETLTDFVSCNMDTLIIYSKGDIFVNQNWVSSVGNYVEIDSNSHNPLLTNKETYEEISEYIKKPLTLAK